MRDFPTQVGPGSEPVSSTTSWTSSNANDALEEIQGAVEDTGQALISLAATADNTQLSTAISRYAAAGTFYNGGGTGNAQALTTIGNYRGTGAYQDGQEVRWIASNGNTASVTIIVDSIGVVDLTKEGGAALVTGDIDTVVMNEARYNSSAGRFELTRGASIGGIAALLDDASPQLGGFLDPNSNYIGWDKGAALASAVSLVIGIDGNQFDVTGTVTITSMTVAANRLFILQFDAALTLTHNASTLILPTGADITTAPGDVAIFFSSGSNTVRCLSYMRADGTALVGVFSGSFVSAEQTITSAGLLTLAHGLGSVPKTIYCYLVCQTANGGYSVSDRVEVGPFKSGDTVSTRGLSVVPDSTNINIRYASGASVFHLVNKSNGTAFANPANVNWKLVVEAFV